jgi:hypothetical protein
MNRTLRSLFTLFFTAVWLAAAFATTSRPLDFDSQPMRTDAPAQASMGAVASDSAGNIYLRYQPLKGSSFRGGLTKIARTGAVTNINIGKIPDIDEGSIALIHAVSPEGRIYSIVNMEKAIASLSGTTYLAVFGNDGSLTSRTPFEFNFRPTMLVPLPDGSVFVAGIRRAKSNSESGRESFTAIFSADGKLRREIHRDSPKLSDEDKKYGYVDKDIEIGQAKLGDDGNVYVSNADGTKITAVSQSGRVVHDVRLEKPFAAAEFNTFFVSGTKLLESFWGKPSPPDEVKFPYVLYELETGKLIAQYEPTFKGIPVKLAGSELTVLTANKAAHVLMIGTADLH